MRILRIEADGIFLFNGKIVIDFNAEVIGKLSSDVRPLPTTIVSISRSRFLPIIVSYLRNASLPIDFTLSGIVMLVKSVQL